LHFSLLIGFILTGLLINEQSQGRRDFMTVIVITGYKSSELGIYKATDPAVDYIKAIIQQELLSMIDGETWVLVSGQLGVELWAAEMVIELRKSIPELRLGIFPPFKEQEKNWNETNQALYQGIVDQANFFKEVSDQPYTSPDQFRKRDLFFIQKSHGAIILYDQEKEGTSKYFWALAKQNDAQNSSYHLRTITFQDLQFFVEEEERKKMDKFF
jgi:uncharacterized phage-like protein YoqJ